MIWIGICLLGVIALLPALISFRRTTLLRDERETALVLHQAQLAELERDLVEGMIAPSEHDSARLEIQRRLLGTDMLPAFVADQGRPPGHYRSADRAAGCRRRAVSDGRASVASGPAAGPTPCGPAA